jgi:hypothetical protein
VGALEIFVAFTDAERAAIALRSIARLWAATGAPSIPSAVATILKIEIEQVKEMLKKFNEGASPSPTPP